MYSYEERLKAVKLYIQYDKSYASVFRELGYPPSNHTLKLWFREYEQNGDLNKSFIKKVYIPLNNEKRLFSIMLSTDAVKPEQ